MATASGSPASIATSSPACAGPREPETGASTYRPPAARTAASSPREYAGAVVPMCTSVRPATVRANAAVSRPSVASIAAPFASMASTTGACSNTSAADAATCAPAARNGAALAAVRVQITSGVPAFSRLAAIGSPISPSPRNPTFTPGSIEPTMTIVIALSDMTTVMGRRRR